MLAGCVVAALMLPGLVLADPPPGPPDPNAGYIKTIRGATYKFHDAKVAEKEGYKPLSAHVPNMGMHYVNFAIQDFDLKRPNVLLYVNDGNKLRLVGVEWSFANPALLSKAPFKGAEIGKHDAACHYVDGSEYPEPDKSKCKDASPTSGAKFAAWHPDLHNIHAYVWWPNSKGVFAKENGLLDAFAAKEKTAAAAGPATRR
jgi:hypothetical protein